MKLHLGSLWLGSWIACLSSAPTALAGSLTVETNRVPAEWVVRHQGRPVLAYTYTPGRYKPYVKELATIDGRNLLRDSPSDHLHHHALMYAIRVNGINFWEELPGSGVQKPVETTSAVPTVRDNGVSSATLIQVLHWLSPENAFLADTAGKALLVERRTLTVSVDEAGREVALRWRSEFEPGQATNEITLEGANYFGLGARFLAELDPVANHFTAAGPLDVANNRQDVSQHPWAAVAFDQPGAAATFALFGHPRNPGGAPWFFSMKTPFAYLSATQRLDQQPRRLNRGERFALEFLAIATPGAAAGDALEARYRRWLTEGP